VTRPSGPAKPAFTPRERRLIARLRTPDAVQDYLNALPYNTEPPPDRPTLRTFRGVVERHTAHCLEAALTAAVILEQHGFPPMLMSLESIDELDHVVFVYRRDGRWGSVARSRDPGLHGRKPVFPTLERLARSYFDPYIDREGCIKAYGATDLGVLGSYDWRLASGNVWKVERLLYAIPHNPLRYSTRRADRLRERYVHYLESHGRKPLYYNRRAWSALPAEYAERVRRGQI
jgi:hypothetical protein